MTNMAIALVAGMIIGGAGVVWYGIKVKQEIDDLLGESSKSYQSTKEKR